MLLTISVYLKSFLINFFPSRITILLLTLDLLGKKWSHSFPNLFIIVDLIEKNGAIVFQIFSSSFTDLKSKDSKFSSAFLN